MNISVWFFPVLYTIYKIPQSLHCRCLIVCCSANPYRYAFLPIPSFLGCPSHPINLKIHFCFGRPFGINKTFLSISPVNFYSSLSTIYFYIKAFMCIGCECSRPCLQTLGVFKNNIHMVKGLPPVLPIINTTKAHYFL